MPPVVQVSVAARHYPTPDGQTSPISPDLARAYMYRGVLFTHMGDLPRARADHAKLLALDQALGTKLERIIAGAGGRDEYDGLSAQYD